jgi:hypothetical protein
MGTLQGRAPDGSETRAGGPDAPGRLVAVLGPCRDGRPVAALGPCAL